ncbi:MAG: hypothetical protein HKM02_06080 [Pseudomonadales bacterium]|nr:hypothetical protein [Pseudomonadales bacterium]
MQILTAALLSAVLSSLITLVVGSYLYAHYVRPRWERRLQDLHQEIGRLVETRVRKAMAEALSDTSAADVLRDRTWQVARSGADIVNDGLNALLGRRKRD